MKYLPCFLLVASTAIAATNSTGTAPSSTATNNFSVSIGTPQSNGSGCPNGSVSTALSPDGSALSVLFSSYTVTAGGTGGPTTAYQGCDLSVPVHVPSGYSVSIVGMDYRGFNSLPAGTNAQFSVEYFLAGSNTSPYTQTTWGPAQSNFLLQHTLNANNVTWSGCGQDAILRINSSIAVTTNSANDQAMSTIDSDDITVNNPAGPQGQTFYLLWNPCMSSTGDSSTGDTFIGGTSMLKPSYLVAAVLLALGFGLE